MNKSTLRTIETVLLLCAVAGAGLLLWPLAVGGNSSREYLSRKGGEAIAIALYKFSEQHGGVYPENDAINGAGGPDALLSENILRHYPINPFSGNSTGMKKVPFGVMSPGDFSYRRIRNKEHMYELVVYGEKGVIFTSRTED